MNIAPAEYDFAKKKSYAELTIYIAFCLCDKCLNFCFDGMHATNSYNPYTQVYEAKSAELRPVDNSVNLHQFSCFQHLRQCDSYGINFLAATLDL